MSITNLDKMFHPVSIAVVGASDKQGSIGAAIMDNLIQGGYKGEIYPVNPRHKKIKGLKALPSVLDIKADIETEIDLAVLAAPIIHIPRIIKECARTGVRNSIIISAGGKETGKKGREIEAMIKNEAGPSGMRIIGPNCLGIICTESGLNASFASRMPLPGKMAFISQSGAICTAILDLSIREHFGFSYFISLGSMLDVDFGDVIDYLGGEPDVNSIVMYVESLTRFRNFMSAARAVSRVKPIIVLKAGRSQAGAKAAASHTGALAGEDAVYDAAFKRAGILRVKTFEELFDCAELLAKQPKPSGPDLAIITNAGGPGVMAADVLSDYGVEPAALSVGTISKLDEILPPFWSKSNPIDMLGEATPKLFRKVVQICFDAKETNGILIMAAPQALTDPTEIAAAIVDLLQKNSFPVFTCWLGGADMEKGRKIFNQAGIPTFDTPERAVRAFMDLYHYGRNIETLQEIPPKLPAELDFDHKTAQSLIQQELQTENGFLSEVDSKALLSAYGIPVNRTETAVSAEEAVRMAKKMGYPIVMKIDSPDITHKTDVGGILLNLKNEFDVREAYQKITTAVQSYAPMAKIKGVTIQPMVQSPDYELILGSKKDRDFGPVILFGMGGTKTEILKDRSIALAPLNRLLATRLMEETKVYRLLQGYRNHPPADLVQLEEILIRLSQFVTDFAEIEELDINPLIIAENNVCAVDARILLKPSEVQSPHHMVISAYPNQYEMHVSFNEVGELFIRSIRPEDAPLLVGLFESLSPRSVYNRFFSPLKRLSNDMLVRFTQIDYDREIALVAIQKSQADEKILGVARVISEVNRKQAEFAIAIGDPWQGKGIGAELLRRSLTIAKEHDIETVYGVVLTENTEMLALGTKLGFDIKRVPYAGEFEMRMDLSKLE